MKFRKAVPVKTEKFPPGVLLADGVYEFTVTSAAEEISKKGNPMLSVVLKIEGKKGESFVYDWLGAWNEDEATSFLQSIGIDTNGEELEILPDEIVGKSGRARVAAQAPEPGSKFKARNETLAYFAPPAIQ